MTRALPVVRLVVALLVALPMLFGAGSARAAATYTMTTIALKGAGGGYSQPLAINAGGTVAAGWYGPGPIVPFSERKGKTKALAKAGLPGGINASGAISGWVTDSSGALMPVLWANGKQTALPAIAGTGGVAWAIDDAGLVVGASPAGTNAAAAWHATAWQNGKAIDLGNIPSGGDSIALAVNNKGAIVGGFINHPVTGSSAYAAVQGRAGYLMDGAQAIEWTSAANTSAQPLVSPNGATASLATGINDAGQIIGIATMAGGVVHAVEWDKGVATDLGALPGGKSSYAFAINAKGQIVGYADNPKPTDPTTDGELAVIWETGKIAVLQDRLASGTGWVVQGANAINDAGQIAAYGFNAQSGYAGFVLTPSGA
jgi:probable HAF family extracellular repeat protein